MRISPVWLTVSKGLPCPKKVGRAYSRPTTGTGMPLEERFGHAPIGACFKRCLPSEITSFVVDSSRSYAKCFWLNWFSGRLFFSDAVRLRRCREFGNGFSAFAVLRRVHA